MATLDIPSPISETSESSFSQTSEQQPHLRPAALNFSRPRPQSSNSVPRLKPDRHDRAKVHTLSAFHDAHRTDLPDEPRFSDDSEPTSSTPSDHSAASEFAWDGERGELTARTRPRKMDEQRYCREIRDRRTTTTASSSTSSGSTRGSGSSSKGSRSAGGRAPASQTTTSSSARPLIVKSVSFDQHSDRVSLSTAAGQQVEDARSHHTVSESGDSGSFDMEGNWQSSDYDTSGLSEKEIRKLQKKGINPALYAEMKAAKKGRNKWIGGPLTGNTFLG